MGVRFEFVLVFVLARASGLPCVFACWSLCLRCAEDVRSMCECVSFVSEDVGCCSRYCCCVSHEHCSIRMRPLPTSRAFQRCQICDD